jgi:hypothetical protein
MPKVKKMPIYPVFNGEVKKMPIYPVFNGEVKKMPKIIE